MSRQNARGSARLRPWGVSVLLCHLLVAAAAGKVPIVLVPAFGGSALDATVDGSDFRRHTWCSRTRDKPFRLWLSEEGLLEDCWMDDMAMRPTVHPGGAVLYRDAQGVNVTAVGFGGCGGIRSLDQPGAMRYGAALIAALEEEGYVCGKNLHGASYDWRKAPPTLESGGFLAHLAGLVEATVRENGRKALLVCHSNGCLAVSWFLSRAVAASWKAANVQAMMSVAAPWLGTPGAIQAVASGDTSWFTVFGHSIVDRLRFRAASRTCGSVLWMAPSPLAWGDQVVVAGPQRNYTASDLRALFADLDAATPGGGLLRAMWDDLELLWGGAPDPGVEVHCLYGSGLPTPRTLGYADGFDRPPVVVTGDGDRTVLRESLEFCRGFKSATLVDLPSMEHHTSIQDPRVARLLKSYLAGLPQASYS